MLVPHSFFHRIDTVDLFKSASDNEREHLESEKIPFFSLFFFYLSLKRVLEIINNCAVVPVPPRLPT